MEKLPTDNLPLKSDGSPLIKGKNNGEGLLYCGKRYTTCGRCICGNCDGCCGPTNGCPCPECDYILSFMLYSSGKMLCGKCNGILIRIPLFSLYKMNSNYSAFICDICRQRYPNYFIPVMHCFNCKYDLCPKCALNKISYPLSSIKISIPHFGSNGGEGLLYCGKNFAKTCLCGTCDGNCGPSNGCPCPECNIILGYNIYLKDKMKCKKCNDGTQLIRVTLKEIRAITNRYSGGAKCNICSETQSNNYKIYYHCFKCDYDICQKCSSKNISINAIVYPPLKKKNSNDIKGNVQNAIQTKKPKPQPVVMAKVPKISGSLKSKEVKGTIANSKSIQSSTTLSNSNQTKVSDSEELTERDKEKLENLKCSVCLDSDKCILFMPCTHMTCCEECSALMDKCPLCRQKIATKIKVHM